MASNLEHGFLETERHSWQLQLRLLSWSCRDKLPTLCGDFSQFRLTASDGKTDEQKESPHPNQLKEKTWWEITYRCLYVGFINLMTNQQSFYDTKCLIDTSALPNCYWPKIINRRKKVIHIKKLTPPPNKNNKITKIWFNSTILKYNLSQLILKWSAQV